MNYSARLFVQICNQNLRRILDMQEIIGLQKDRLGAINFVTHECTEYRGTLPCLPLRAPRTSKKDPPKRRLGPRLSWGQILRGGRTCGRGRGRDHDHEQIPPTKNNILLLFRVVSSWVSDLTAPRSGQIGACLRYES